MEKNLYVEVTISLHLAKNLDYPHLYMIKLEIMNGHYHS